MTKMKRILIPGELRIYTGGMGGGKTHQAISNSNDRKFSLRESILVVQPGVSFREGIDDNGKTKARSSVAAESILIPYDHPFEILELAKKSKANLVTITDSHMFSAEPIAAVVYGLLNSGVDVYLDCLKYDYGGKVFPVLRELIDAANLISYNFRQCGCQEPGEKPKGYYNQLIVNTLFGKKKEVLELLKSKKNPDQKLIYLVEHGTKDKKTGLILPAYFGATNITGDIATDLILTDEVSDKISYITRCRECFTKPKNLTEYLQ